MKKATQQHTKRHNRDLVLRTVFGHSTVSRAEIARITGLTRTTVSQIVAGLMAEGLVREVGVGSSRGGKSPILLSLVADSRHVIGLDLAQDRFCGALVNLRGEIRQTIDLPVPSGNGDEALASVYELLDGLVGAASRPIVGIGGNARPRRRPPGRGRERGEPQLAEPAAGPAPARALRLPASVLNDSQAAALGEHAFGGGYRPDESLVVVNVRHGIGAGIVLNGQLFHGDGGGAGEIGHVAVAPESGLRCRCGNFGCLETLASTRAVVERARALAPQVQGGELAANPEAITFESLVRAFAEADTLARRVVLEAGGFMGQAVSSLVGTLNVRRIVIAGDMARFGRPLLDAIRETMARTTLARLASETTVEFEHLGHNEIILGASALILRDYSLLFTRQRDRAPTLVERGPPADASSSGS
jgi:predicted NBD/HSP70 family sugar kinase